MVSRDIWDVHLRENGGHLLQCWAWREFKREPDWCPEREMIETGDGLAMVNVLFRHAGPVSIGYVPRGPMLVGDPKALWPLLRAEIDRKARRRALSVIIEADCESVLRSTQGDRRMATGPCSIQPGRTVRVPLLEDEALKQMQPNRFPNHPREYYSGALRAFVNDSALLGAWTEDGRLAAALIVARFDHEVIYLYGASSTRHRAHGAELAIQFAAMQWARERGAKTYDLWGIPRRDPDTTTEESDRHIAGTSGKDWRDLYRFKIGFGGEIIS